MADVCDRCGVYVGRHGERVGLLLNGSPMLTVTLCVRCRSTVEDQVRAALRGRLTHPIVMRELYRP